MISWLLFKSVVLGLEGHQNWLNFNHVYLQSYKDRKGAQWLSGRVLDSRPKGHGFEPHRRHCIVSLSKNINPSLVLVQPRKTRPFITERLLMGRKESNQTKQNKQNKDRTLRHIIPFKLNGIYCSFQLGQSISNLRDVWWYFSFLFKF